MPKAVAAPLPSAPYVGPSPREHSRAAKELWQAQPIEARVSALEARWEETVPTLATSRDLSELRAELQGSENRLIKWVLGAAFGLLFAILGIFFSGYTSVNARIDSVAAELRAEIRETNARMEARFERIESKFERIDAKFERMDAKFDALMAELRSQRNDAR